MKKITLLLMALFMALGATAAAGDEAQPINPSKLPSLAQKIVSAYFKGDIASASKQKGHFKNDYMVELANGERLLFDKDGNWIEVECESVPMRLLNGRTQMYMSKSHPGATVVKLEKDRKTRTVAVTLADGTVLHFDADGKFLPGED